MDWIGGNWLIALAAVLLIAGVSATSIRNIRWFALAAGLLASAHFALGAVNWAPLILSLLFTAANGARLFAMLKRSESGTEFEDERELFEHVMQVENPVNQGRLRDLIRWEDYASGHILMRQDELAPALIYIASGHAEISRDGQNVGACGPGDFLGEMSVVSGERASATVTVTEAMRCARFDRDALSDLVRNVPDLGKAIDAALNRSLAAKVLRMNKAAAALSTQS